MHVWLLSNVSAHITIDCLYCESRLHVCMYVSGHILIHQIPFIVINSNVLLPKQHKKRRAQRS